MKCLPPYKCENFAHVGAAVYSQNTVCDGLNTNLAKSVTLSIKRVQEKKKVYQNMEKFAIFFGLPLTGAHAGLLIQDY